MKNYEWQSNPPEQDGDFYYSGPLPDGTDVVAIVQVFTHPENKKRMACILIPPGWRTNEKHFPTIHAGPLNEWRGQWAGPEHGLCCVESQYNGE